MKKRMCSARFVSITGNEKGFTLIEVIIVGVITAVLLGLAALSLAQYVKVTNFRKNNEYAQSIYIAAQTALTHYKVTGEYEEFAAEIKKSGTQMNASMTETPNGDVEYGRLYSVSKGQGSDASSLVCRLLDPYLYDKSILNAAICIELDPDDGVVTGVFYSDTADSLYYGAPNHKRSPACMTMRAYEDRQEINLGYYDASSLSDAAPGSLGKPEIEKLTLVNGETLHLTWALKGAYRNVPNIFTYTIKLYTSLNEDDPFMTLEVPGAWFTTRKQFQELKLAGTDTSVSFSAYVDEEGWMYLILDAIDLNAAGEGVDYGSTTSVQRIRELLGDDFALDTDKIHIRMQVSGLNYKSSSWKQTNAESPYFGELKSEGISISNMRHLFNLRFSEAEIPADAGFNYMQTADFAWGGESGILANGNVYASGETVEDMDSAFPPIPKLTEHSVYSGVSGLLKKRYTISAVILKNGFSDSVAPLGIFGRNEGTLSGVTVSDAYSEGNRYVSMLCGINCGEISNAKVSGTVSGGEYVGAVAGSNGYDGETGTILACANTGEVLALTEDAMKLGGITGYQTNGSSVTESTSSVALTDEKLEAFAAHTADLWGTYVGGIVGYCEPDGVVSSCFTGEGYVAGSEYVGGIIGFKETGDTEMILDGNGRGNASYVIGEKYVGGIIGAVTRIEAGEPTDTPSPLIIANWRNTGIVAASEAYSGGITGYNCGILSDCLVEVNTVASKTAETVELSKRLSVGDMAGGVAGYNAGTIRSLGKGIQVTAIVAGRNAVGGIVGCNGTDAAIEGMALSGGYISGNCFVGGIVGLNHSAKLFGETVITAKPNQVAGACYVGGIIGANLMQTAADDKKDYFLHGTVDNFLGSVTASTGAVGGMIGYNGFTQAEDVSDLVEMLLPAQEVDVAITPEQLVETVRTFDTQNVSEARLRIRGEETVCRLSKITGGVLTGGVIGYHDANTVLTVENLSVNTPITATASVPGEREEAAYRFSYVGGITGIVTEKMEVVSCANGSMALIRGQGTFLGGLCEVNFGEIRQCEAVTLTAGVSVSAGGLAGINGESGQILGCTFTGTVSGGPGSGGFVSVNRGVIGICRSGEEADEVRNVLAGKVTVTGENAGGAAGSNEEGGTISGISITTLVVAASGENAGGVVGFNYGAVTDAASEAGASVTGLAYVGGIIGRSISAESMSLLVNRSAVTSENGYAGGIVGHLAAPLEKDNGSTVSPSELSLSSNYGKIVAKKGNAGGITSVVEKQVTLTACANNGEIEANRGSASGRAAENSGSIIECICADEKPVTVKGEGAVGGITATNRGLLKHCIVYQLTVSGMQNAASAGCFGGIAGGNETGGEIIGCAVAEDVVVSALVAGSAAGGVVGLNAGIVNGVTEDGKTGVAATVSFTNDITVGWLGGIVGENTSTGKVTGYQYSGVLTGNSGSAYGYGGIAGLNEGTITACVNAGELTASGTSADKVNLGGIAGVNGSARIARQSALISDCVIEDCTIKAACGYVGGIVGQNYAKVTQSGSVTAPNEEASEKSVRIEARQGDIAGIVGRNEQYGDVNRCETGASWSIVVYEHAVDNTAAGIIGYNLSDKTLYSLVNRAAVTKTAASSNSVGGIIGRIENNTSSTWELAGCKNYGTITGRERVGGIVGQIKYHGGTITDCENHGNIYGNYIGGIVAYLYGMNDSARLEIADCINFAYLAGQNGRAPTYAGGILGSTPSMKKVDVYLTDCVNTGAMNVNSAYASGIAYADVRTLTLTRCRNYGYSTNNGQLAGITAASNATMEQCFGVASTYAPLSRNAAQNARNYYFGKAGAEGALYISALSVMEATSATDDTVKKITDGNLQTFFTISQKTISEEAPVNIDFSLSKETELSKLQLLFGAPEGDRPYTYAYRVYWACGGSDYQEVTSKDGAMFHAISAKSVSEEELAQCTFDPVTVDKIRVSIVGVSYEMPSEQSDITEVRTEVLYEPVRVNTAVVHEVYVGPIDNTINFEIGMEYDAQNNAELQITVSNIRQSNPGNEIVLIKSASGAGYTGKSAYNNLAIEGIQNNPNRAKKSDMTYVAFSRQNYEEIDPLLTNYYAEHAYAADSLSPPSNLSASDVGGAYKLSWTYKGNTAYAYEVRVYVSTGGAETEEVFTVRSISSIIYTIEDESLFGNASLRFTVQALGYPTEDDSARIKSEVASSQPTAILKMLPLPEVSVFFEGTSNNVVLRVENIREYAGIACTINLKINGTTYSAKTTGTDTSEFFKTTKTLTNSGMTTVATSAWADGNARYGQSRTSAKQTATVLSTWMNNNKIVHEMRTKGFHGISNDDLSYEVVLWRQGSGDSMPDGYYRSEFVVQDEELGEVVVAYANTYMTPMTSSALISLDNLSDDLYTMDEVTVRTYISGTKNQIIRYLRPVAENVSRDEIKTCMDAYTGTAIWNTAADTLQMGYILQYVGTEAGYTWENGQLVETETDRFDILYSSALANRTDGRYKNHYFSKLIPLTDLVQPQPVINDVYTEDKENGVFVFTWDTTEDGAWGCPDASYAVQVTGHTPEGIEVVLVTEENLQTNQISVPLTNWNYQTVTLKVTRLGTVSGGYTTKLASVSERRINMKLTLPAVSQPTLHLQTKDELIYTVLWEKIVYARTEEREAHTGYTVYAVDCMTEPNEELIYTTSVGADVTEAEIDFGETNFPAHSNVYIYVTATASETQELYVDSQAGTPYMLELPERLAIPDEVSIDVEYDPANPLSIAEFEQGIEVNASADIDSYAGWIVFHGFLIENQTTDFSPDVISSEAVRVYQTKPMNGSLQEATYTITDIPAEYAAYYLYLRVRSTSNNAISSLWSEYQMFRLPVVQLDAPVLAQSSMETADMVEQYATLTGETRTTSEYHMHPTVSFTGDGTCADVYEIQIAYADNSNDTILVTQTEGAVDVTCNSEPIPQNELISTWNLYRHEAGITYTHTVGTSIACELINGQLSVTVTLPDTAEQSITKKVSVQAKPSEKNAERYAESELVEMIFDETAIFTERPHYVTEVNCMFPEETPNANLEWALEPGAFYSVYVSETIPTQEVPGVLLMDSETHMVSVNLTEYAGRTVYLHIIARTADTVASTIGQVISVTVPNIFNPSPPPLESTLPVPPTIPDDTATPPETAEPDETTGSDETTAEPVVPASQR